MRNTVRVRLRNDGAIAARFEVRCKALGFGLMHSGADVEAAIGFGQRAPGSGSSSGSSTDESASNKDAMVRSKDSSTASVDDPAVNIVAELGELSGVIEPHAFASFLVACTPVEDVDMRALIALRWQRAPGSSSASTASGGGKSASASVSVSSEWVETPLPIHVGIAHPRLEIQSSSSSGGGAAAIDRLHFGTVFLKRAGAQTVELVNAGDGPCAWSAAHFPACLSVEPASGHLVPAQRVAVRLVFRPTDMGALNCTVTFGGASVKHVALACVGLVSVAQIAFPPNTIDTDFGTARVGRSTTGGFELANPGAIAVQYIVTLLPAGFRLPGESGEGEDEEGGDALASVDAEAFDAEAVAAAMAAATRSSSPALSEPSSSAADAAAPTAPVFRVVCARGTLAPKERCAIQFECAPHTYAQRSAQRFHIRVGLNDMNHHTRQVRRNSRAWKRLVFKRMCRHAESNVQLAEASLSLKTVSK